VLRYAFLLIALALAGTARAADPWTSTDSKLLGGAIGLMVIDWGQTHDLARRNQAYYTTPACQDPETRSLAILYNGSCPMQSTRPYREVNPLLPKNPSSGDVDKYFVLAIAGTAGLAYVLPVSWRRPFLGTVIVLESIVVLHNHNLGLRLTF
jgi:hypothetical protein